MDDFPKLTDALPAGGIGALLVALCWAISKLVEKAVIPWWNHRREDRQDYHQHTKEETRDAIKEAWRNVVDARNERDACIKQLNEAKDLLSACRVESATCKVEIKHRDNRILELERELNECRGTEGD